MTNRIPMEGYFLVRGGDKKCGEYKNENWVKIWDLINIKELFLVRKNGENGEI